MLGRLNGATMGDPTSETDWGALRLDFDRYGCRCARRRSHGKNGRHRLAGLLRQSVFGRLAGYEDVNDADRLYRATRQCAGWSATVRSPGLLPPPANSGDVARSFRDHVVRCSDMMSPAWAASCWQWFFGSWRAGGQSFAAARGRVRRRLSLPITTRTLPKRQPTTRICTGRCAPATISTTPLPGKKNEPSPGR